MPSLSDPELVLVILNQILEAASRIERRFAPINMPDDFLNTEEGVGRMDGIGMMLIVIGESVKNLDKVTGGTLLPQFPEVDWKGVKGARDILSHHYVSVDAEVVFGICKNHIPVLVSTIRKIIEDVKNSSAS
ncbi:MAG TPA: HepT-like ribonuclease domain-containing protein [Rhodothermales bacterium]|nr:HepT-like ribonuclease domain-containing protein [Rhodothermales bacterium]